MGDLFCYLAANYRQHHKCRHGYRGHRRSNKSTSADSDRATYHSNFDGNRNTANLGLVQINRPNIQVADAQFVCLHSGSVSGTTALGRSLESHFRADHSF